MPFSMKMDTALLFGLCILVTVDSMTTHKSLTRTADAAATADLSNATEQQTTRTVTQQLHPTWTSVPKLAEVDTLSSRGVGTDQVTGRKSGLHPSNTIRTSGATSNAQRLFTDSVSPSDTTRAQLSYKTSDATHKPSPTSLAASLQPIPHTDATSMVRSTSKRSTQNLTNSTSPVPLFSMTKTSTKTGHSPTTIYKTSPLLFSTTGSTSSRSPSPRLIPQTSTKSLPTSSTTTPPIDECRTTASSSVKSCSTRGLVSKCLIAIGALALLATIFMVSTIVLCAKQSARKYKPRRHKESTEMICISSLLPERHHNYARQRNPVANGVLVFPAGGDSDEDGGDNLTLRSFLPESV